MKLRTSLLPALCLAALLPAAASAQTISTVAGNGGNGTSGDGGPASAAETAYPTAVAAAADGGFYLGGWSIVRRVRADGTITTVAGDGSVASSGDGGPATAAKVGGNIGGLAVGPDGSVYVSDWIGHRIRKIAPNGIISTVALVDFPEALAFDAAGNLYIGSDACALYRLAPAGALARIAGTGACGTRSGDGGPALAAGIAGIVHGIAVDAAGNVWFSDHADAVADRRVRKVRPDGIIESPVFANIAPPIAPVGVAADAAGNVYVVDRPATVLRIAADGTTGSVVAGTGSPGFAGDGGPATEASLDHPWGVAVGNGALFIADSFNHRIRKVAMEVAPVPLTPAVTCASAGYTSTKLEWCKNICERGYTGPTLDMWIRRWVDRYRILPYCAMPSQPVPTAR